MIQRVVEPGREGDGGEGKEFMTLKRHGGADSEEDDPDIFHAVVGEEPLDIVLHQGVQNAEDGRDRTDRDDGHSPPLRSRAGDIQDDPDQPVDSGLDHDAGHQGRDVGRRNGMRPGEPGMQGDDPRLGAEPDDGKDEDHVF